MNIFTSVVTGLLSVFFLFASSIKLLGWQKMIFDKQLAFFHSYGFNRQFMFLVGLTELFGAIAIWFQGSFWGVLGALALAGTSMGAIVCHLRFDTWKDGIPAMITLVLSSMVVYFSYSLK
ncbi:DoxX family protein [Photobacterium alginatilyticum]|uniref:DoxX family protein n=1 Tax=Photobacterium alginatilyticum TaxID=1775171 RepID=A0ABW9YF62_9GAMM|nr:DoxX family protein [Photobacterium alginatilyticum]NBI51921.1 DoxX family protein [Photobacterium alginatilyticum]